MHTAPPSLLRSRALTSGGGDLHRRPLLSASGVEDDASVGRALSQQLVDSVIPDETSTAHDEREVMMVQVGNGDGGEDDSGERLAAAREEDGHSGVETVDVDYHNSESLL